MHGPGSNQNAPSGDRGFILLAVLLVSLVLIAAASVFTHAVRSRIRLTAETSRAAQAEALADAGVHLAILDIENSRQDPNRARRYPTAAEPLSCTAPNGAGMVTIQVLDEAGKINLNSSNEQLLQTFMIGIGASEEASSSLVQRILDYRDADTIPREQGAEFDSDGSLAGETRRLVKNRPFDAIEELDQVPGIPRAVFESARPYITVHSDIDGFDPALSPPGLRDIIARGVNTGAWQGNSNASSMQAAVDGIPAAFLARSPRRALAIIATASTPSGARFTRQVLLKVPAIGNGDLSVRRWTQASQSLAVRANADLPPC